MLWGSAEPIFKDSVALLSWKCLSIAVGAHRTKLLICFQQITHWYTLWSQGILHHRNYLLFFVSRNRDESYAAHLLLIQQKASAGQWFCVMQNLKFGSSTLKKGIWGDLNAHSLATHLLHHQVSSSEPLQVRVSINKVSQCSGISGPCSEGTSLHLRA